MPEWKILCGGSITLMTVGALSSNPQTNPSCLGSKLDSLPNGGSGIFREKADTRVQGHDPQNNPLTPQKLKGHWKFFQHTWSSLHIVSSVFKRQFNIERNSKSRAKTPSPSFSKEIGTALILLSSNSKCGHHQTSSNTFSENSSRGWFSAEQRMHGTRTWSTLTRPGPSQDTSRGPPCLRTPPQFKEANLAFPEGYFWSVPKWYSQSSDT